MKYTYPATSVGCKFLHAYFKHNTREAESCLKLIITLYFFFLENKKLANRFIHYFCIMPIFFKMGITCILLQWFLIMEGNLDLLALNAFSIMDY